MSDKPEKPKTATIEQLVRIVPNVNVPPGMALLHGEIDDNGRQVLVVVKNIDKAR